MKRFATTFSGPKLSKRRLFLVLICYCSLHLVLFFCAPAFAEDKKEADPAAPSAPLEPGADYVCEADVFYTWRPDPPPKPKREPGAPIPPPTAEPSPTPLDPIKVYFTVAGEQGLVEKEARQRLESKLPEIRRQAAEACRASHQDTSTCVSARLQATLDSYTKLDFTARRTMLESINSDCQSRKGSCLSDEAGEIRCYVNRSPEVPEKVEPEAGKEKEKKK